MEFFKIIVNIFDILFRLANMFLPGLLLYLTVSCFVLKRKRPRVIIILAAFEAISIVFYCFEIKTGYFGYYSVLGMVEVLSALFSLAANNIVYMVLMVKASVNCNNKVKRTALILLAPAITAVLIAVWFAVRNLI